MCITWKKIALKSCVICWIVFFQFASMAYSEQEAQKYLDKAIALENDGSLKLSRNVLEEGYDKTNEISILKHWTDMDDRYIDTLKQRTKNKSIIKWEAIELKKSDQSRIPLYSRRYNLRKQIEWEKGHPIEVLPVGEINDVLDKFDQLKESQYNLEKILCEKITKASEQEFAVLKDLLNKHKEISQKLIKFRCNYVSYDAISPYLARTKQLIFISDDSILTWLHSEQDLREAAKMLEKGAHGNLILESNQDVRDQFIDVLKQFNETAGKKEKEDLKVLSTYTDRLSKEKNLGSQKWWY